MAGNTNYDTLLASTMAKYGKKLEDNVFLDLPFLYWMMENGRKRMIDGGEKIVEPLIYADGEAGSYSGYDALTITPQEGITAAEFTWRQIYATIAISGIEELKNSGDSAVFNLLKAKVMQAEKTLKTSLSTQMWKDTPGNSGKEFDGILKLVGDEDSTVTTVGGINCATAGNEFWRSQVSDLTDVTLSTGVLQARLTTAYNNAADGSDTVDAIFMSQDVYELYEATLTPNVRYADVKAANAGFETLRFKNTTVFFDKGAPVGHAVGINSDYVSLVGHSKRWFKQTPFTDGLSAAGGGTATTVDARYSIITAAGNTTISNRQRQFLVKGIGQES